MNIPKVDPPSPKENCACCLLAGAMRQCPKCAFGIALGIETVKELHEDKMQTICIIITKQGNIMTAQYLANVFTKAVNPDMLDRINAEVVARCLIEKMKVKGEITGITTELTDRIVVFAKVTL